MTDADKEQIAALIAELRTELHVPNDIIDHVDPDELLKRLEEL